ncbi:hypothetical protein ACRALDRAFT_2038391 [Sodiomyces alcalophilus JCM 7366]|uniref:uncharacterized protein n=1 Tax=Sodiomyces alcalophilus JCM 7366 TaxID=591952 RepID=UPI0039B6017C
MEFIAKAKNGEVQVDSHDQVLRIAFIYMDEGLWGGYGCDYGVFSVVERLHKYGWSFGQGHLKFNRTLDIFYLAQIAAGIYRSTNQLQTNVYPKPDDFDIFYARHYQLLNQDAWKEYYSPAFLAQPLSARFYRLPDLRDLPDASDPLKAPRQKGIGHHNKLPCWAYNVVRTHQRQSTLPVETIIQIALSTLEQTISRQRKEFPSPSIQPYSETQARFWLKYMKIDDSSEPVIRQAWTSNRFGSLIAQGWYDAWGWERDYSRQRWEASIGVVPPLDPDLDETLYQSEVTWCGYPDGGITALSWYRGWDAELGSEEDLAFLAAVAVKETEGIDTDTGMDNLDYAIRSHILLGVMRVAFKMEMERAKDIDDLKGRIVKVGRIDEESKAEEWIRQALMVMEPYVPAYQGHDGWPATVEDRSELLRKILVENGHLFGRWTVCPSYKEFDFELNPRVS